MKEVLVQVKYMLGDYMILYHPERKEVLVETLHKDTSEETACQEIGYDIYHQDSNSCIDTESYET
jgi:hypothetical protein